MKLYFFIAYTESPEYLSYKSIDFLRTECFGRTYGCDSLIMCSIAETRSMSVSTGKLMKEEQSTNVQV